MSIQARKIFFYVLLAAFLTFGTGIVFYSQGYRFDRKEFAVKKIGGIFVKSAPQDAAITLNGKAIKNKSWFLQSGTLINNLIPGTYELGIIKDNYRPWKKTVKVLPSLVTEMDTIVLLGNEPPQPVDSGIVDAWFAGGKILIRKGNRITYGTQAITGDEFLELSPDGKFALAFSRRQNAYFITDIGAQKAALNVNLLFKNLKERVLNLPGEVRIRSIAFHPGDSQRIFIGTERAVYLLNRDRLHLALLDSEGLDFWQMTPRGLIWQNHKGEAYQYRNGAPQKEPLLAQARLTGARSGLANFAYGLLEEGGGLSLLAEASATRTHLAEDALLFSFSPDAQKAAYVSRDGDIHVLNLKKDKNISYRVPEGGSVETLGWYKDSEHLFVKLADGRLYFTENDGFAPQNAYRIADEIRKFFYDSSADTLYLLRNGELLSFVFD